MTDQFIISIAIVKGVLMTAIIMAIAETTFIQGLITAICSATVSGTFLLLSVHLTSKKTDAKIEDTTKEVLEGQDSIKVVLDNGNSK